MVTFLWLPLTLKELFFIVDKNNHEKKDIKDHIIFNKLQKGDGLPVLNVDNVGHPISGRTLSKLTLLWQGILGVHSLSSLFIVKFVSKRICTLKKLKSIFIIAQNRRKTFKTYTKTHMKLKPWKKLQRDFYPRWGKKTS